MFIARRLTVLSFVLSLGVAAVVSMGGCTRDNPAFNPEPILPDQCREGGEVSETFEDFERPDLLDILFVVDNAGDVLDQQSALARAMPDLLEPLAQEKIHTRVAVMTADATGAVALAPAGKQGASCERNQKNIADSNDQNWQTVAACNVMQGRTGDSYLRVFDVLERALLEQPEALVDFRREHARLLIVVVSNEDDCSAAESLGNVGSAAVRNHCLWNADKLRDVGAFTDALRASAKTPEGIALAVISGPPSTASYETGADVRPICTGALGSAYQANRLYQATQNFGASGQFFSACTNAFVQPMREIARNLALIDSVTFCPVKPLAHEPLYVQTMRDGVPLDLGIGEQGVIFLGRTADCENGALRVSSSALYNIDDVKTAYCVLP